MQPPTAILKTFFATLARLNAGALIIVPDGFLISRSQQLASLALRHAVPAFFQNREFAAAGGLISYGGSSGDAWHLVGAYTGRMLKGEKPRDLPIQQPTKVELDDQSQNRQGARLTSLRRHCSLAPTR